MAERMFVQYKVKLGSWAFVGLSLYSEIFQRKISDWVIMIIPRKVFLC